MCMVRPGAARSARRERQRRSIIQPRVVSFQRNYPGSIPPNQTANPERVDCRERIAAVRDWSPGDATHSGLRRVAGAVPRVARSGQPWAG